MSSGAGRVRTIPVRAWEDNNPSYNNPAYNNPTDNNPTDVSTKEDIPEKSDKNDAVDGEEEAGAPSFTEFVNESTFHGVKYIFSQGLATRR